MFKIVNNFVYLVHENGDEFFYREAFNVVLTHEETKVIAKVFNYLDELQEDFNEPIVFQYNNEKIEVLPQDGIAELEIEYPPLKTIIIRTVNEGIRNDEITIEGIEKELTLEEKVAQQQAIIDAMLGVIEE